LLATQTILDRSYYDPNGASTTWYKIQFWDSVNSVASDYSDAFQADTFRGYCFAPGTKILAESGYVEIQTIHPDQKVFGGDGRLYKVKKVLNRKFKGKMLAIKPLGDPGFTCTADHNLLVYERDSGSYFKNKPLLPVWKRADKLKKGDLLIYPAVMDSREQIDDAESYLLGLFVAEGYVSKEYQGKKQKISRKVTFTYNKHEKELITTTIKLIKDIWGHKANTITQKNATRVYFGSKSVSKMLLNVAYIGAPHLAHHKRIPPKILSNGSFLSFLKGYFEGDGSLVQGIKENRISFTTVSETLIQQLKIGLVSLGIYASESCRKGGRRLFGGKRMIDCKDCYQLVVTGKGFIKLSALLNLDYQKKIKTKEYSKYTVSKSDILVPIRTITSSEYEGIVWDLEVDKVHQMLVNGFVTHNCTVEDIRNMTNITTSDLTDTEVCNLITYAGVMLNADMQIYEEEEEVEYISNTKSNEIDGSNTVYYTKHYPIGDLNDDFKVDTDDVKVYQYEDDGTRTELTVSAITTADDGKITLSAAPAASTVTLTLTYKWAQRSVYTPSPLIKQAVISLVGFLAYRKINIGKAPHWRMGSTQIWRDIGAQDKYYQDYNRILTRLNDRLVMDFIESEDIM